MMQNELRSNVHNWFYVRFEIAKHWLKQKWATQFNAASTNICIFKVWIYLIKDYTLWTSRHPEVSTATSGDEAVVYQNNTSDTLSNDPESPEAQANRRVQIMENNVESNDDIIELNLCRSRSLACQRA